MSLFTNLFRLTPPTLRPGFCPRDWQSLANAIIGGTRLTFLINTGNFLFNFGDSAPSPENRVFPWLRTSDGRWYIYRDGVWASPFPMAAGPNGYRALWVGIVDNSAAGLWRLDGGDGVDPGTTAPTAYTGSFWEVDTAFEGRVPLGVGTVPGTTTPVVNVAVGATGGAGEITPDIAHMAAHSHITKITRDSTISGDTDESTVADQGVAGTTLDWPSESVGDGQPYSILPPYVGCYVIKRTARAYYTVAG